MSQTSLSNIKSYCKVKSSMAGYAMAMENKKPYIALVFIQFVYAGMALFSKAAISKGMNPFVFVVYRQAFAALALAPFAFFFERSVIFSYKLTNFLSLFFSFSFFWVDLTCFFFMDFFQWESCSFVTHFALQNFLCLPDWVCSTDTFDSIIQ